MVGAAVLALVIGVFVGERVERGALAGWYARLCACDVTLGSVWLGPGTLHVRELSARRPGEFAFTADELDMPFAGGTVSVGRPQLTVDALPGALAQVRDALARVARLGELAGGRAVGVEDGRVTLRVGGTHPVETTAAVHGTIEPRGESTTYELAIDLAGAQLRAVGARGAGAILHTISASELPLSALAAASALAAPELSLRDGIVRNLSVRYDGATRSATGQARVESGTLGFGNGHRITGLHGPVTLAGDALGTSGARASLDDAPFELRGRFAVSDLRAVGGLVAAIADDGRLPGHREVGPLRELQLDAIARGVVYAAASMTTTDGPRVVHVLAVDPHAPGVHLDTVIAGDHVLSGGERTSTLAARTHALAGVNGDYFDIGRTYQPQGMLVRSGVFMRSPSEREALAVHRDGRVTFDLYRFGGELRTAHNRIPVTRLNDNADYISVVTPEYGSVTLPASDTFAELAPVRGKPDAYRVTRIGPATGAMKATFGVAFGPLVRGPLPHAGETVELRYGTTPALDGVVAAVGGGPLLLRDGAWYEDPHAPAPDERDVRWPVVALGRLADQRLLLVAVDGRHPERAVGMTRPEFADLLQTYGVRDAMALDSGGSVTMVSRLPGENEITVRNRPSDNDGERFISDALMIYGPATSP